MNNSKLAGSCMHGFWVSKGAVFLANDDDSFYITEFNTREEIENFIAQARKLADEAFGPKEPSQ